VVGDDPTPSGPVGEADDAAADAGADAARPERLLAAYGASLCTQIVSVIPDWVERAVDGIVDAWASAGGDVDRALVGAEAAEAGRRAAADVADRLRAVLSADVDAQSTTPLEVVRSAVVYPTGVLLRAGVPGVVRDAFDEARFPDDAYGLTPASLGAVDPTLVDPARDWGAAKAMAHKARHTGPRSSSRRGPSGIDA
jgi:hypothetical protein